MFLNLEFIKCPWESKENHSFKQTSVWWKELSTKKTQLTFWGKNCNTYGRKTQSNFLDLESPQTNVIIAIKFRSLKWAISEWYAFNKKIMDHDKRRSLKLLIMIIFIVLPLVFCILHQKFYSSPQTASFKMSLLP